MNSIMRAALIASWLLISGCASMNKDQCQMADWQALGYEQGSQGDSMTRFNTYQNNCAKHHIKADFDAFKAGHVQGLQTYCTFDQGLNSGKHGADYNAMCPRSRFPTFEEGYRSGINRYCDYSNGMNIGAKGKDANPNCPIANYPDFHHGYAAGQQHYQLGQHINALEEDLESLQDAMDETSDHINAAEAIIISETSTSDARKHALEIINSDKKQYRQLDRDYHDLLNELNDAKQQYDALLRR